MTVPRCLVSVCVPAFNGARYIGAAVRSVLAQTFDDFEVLVVDDGSTDGTRAVVETMRDERVRLVGHRFHLGLVANWNCCLDLSRGRYVTVFHQDDLMAPDNLEAKVRFLEREPTVGFVHSNVVQIDADGRLLSECWSVPPRSDDEGRHDGAAYFERLLTGANPVCAPSVVMRREAFERLGGFDPRLPFTADWEMWMRIALFHDVGYLARPLLSYRRHEAMETEAFPTSRQLEQAYLAKMRVLDKHSDRMPDVEALRSRIAREYRDRALGRMRQALDTGRPIPAAEYLAVALGVRAGGREAGDHDVAAVREIFEALGGGAHDVPLREAAERAQAAEIRIRELAREIDERDRTIEAMTRTRVWRAARAWWDLKRMVGQRLRRR
jgi:glycosyltransferase involved in cell wall biosynthesis